MEVLTFNDNRLDPLILFASGILRNFVYGATFVFLIDFMILKNIDNYTIGIVQAIFILSDALITFFLPFFISIGCFNLLKITILIKVIAMFEFAYQESTLIVIALAFSGIISVTGSQIGPFKKIELAGLSTLTKNNRVEAQFISQQIHKKQKYYEILTTFAKGFGALFSGYYINYQYSSNMNRQYLKERMSQTLYICSGVVALNLVLYLLVSRQAQPKQNKDPSYSQNIKKLSKKVVPYLRFIYFFDGLGSGFTSLSSVAYVLSVIQFESYENLGRYFFFAFSIATLIKVVTVSLFKGPISFETHIVMTSIISNGSLLMTAYFLSKDSFLASLLIIACIAFDSIQAQVQDCNAKSILDFHFKSHQGAITYLIKKAGTMLALCASGYLLVKQIMFLLFLIGALVKLIITIFLLVFNTWSQRVDQEIMVKNLQKEGQLRSLSQLTQENDHQYYED